MRRIKVFFLITGIHVGGAERLLLGLTRCLDRERFEPVVGTLVGGTLFPEFERAGVRVHNLAMRHKLDVGVIVRLRRILREERPHILHTHLIYADLLGRLVGRWCGVPVVVSTVHAVESIRFQWLWKTIDRWASRLNDALTAVSEQVKRGVVDVEGLDPERIQVIPNGVEWVDPPDARQEYRDRLNVPRGAWLIGVVAGLYRGGCKGHHILLQALRSLKQLDVHCVMIGDGPNREALEAQTRELGLEDRVHFVGLQCDIPAWLSALDVFVLPSLDEGAPMAVIEAMAAGCPIIATRVGGVPELIIDGESGVLVPPGDAQALGVALRRLVNSRSLAMRLGQAGQQRFHERFDLRQVVRQTEAMYERLLFHKTRPRRLKLLEVATSLDPGGVTTYLANMVRSLPRDRFEISLASGSEAFQPSLIRSLGVPHHMVRLTKAIRPLTDLVAVWQLYRLMRRHRFDIVHTNMCKADLVAGLAARLCGIPYILSTAHGPTRLTAGRSMRQALFDRLEALVYRCLHHRVISVSTSTTRALLAKRKVRPEQLVTISNGIDEREARGASDRWRVRRALSIRPEQTVVVMVGRLTLPKTPEVLLHSVRDLVRRWPDLICMIVGEGPQMPRLAHLIQHFDLTRTISLLGRRDDVPALLTACDIFALSTSSEGMPMSILEAMAAGLPVVASRVDGMDELVEHTRTGLLVSPGDSAALAQAIDALLRDPARRRAMGAAGLTRMRMRFNLPRQVERTQQVLLAAGRPWHRVPSETGREWGRLVRTATGYQAAVER